MWFSTLSSCVLVCATVWNHGAFSYVVQKTLIEKATKKKKKKEKRKKMVLIEIGKLKPVKVAGAINYSTSIINNLHLSAV